MPALQPREVSFQDLKFLAPNEGRIAKDPQILRCGPIRQDGLERGRGEGLVTPIGGGEGVLFQNWLDGSSVYFHANLHVSWPFPI